jgi:selenocysteine-specific elongation factor
VIGRIADDRLLLDLRCLEDPPSPSRQLPRCRRRCAMIVGTAGHIDHGKTRWCARSPASTPTACPRRSSAASRSSSASPSSTLPDGTRIGFIDVPGHERLVHTMLAGATGIDAALLLVAADDGVMPQTREHGTPLAGAPVLAVSAHHRPGLGAARAAAGRRPRARGARGDGAQAAFRLAVDRVFTLDGVGTVVTGTVHAGQVAAGDELRSCPAARAARVRSLHAQNRACRRPRPGSAVRSRWPALDARPGQRGQWLVAPAVAAGDRPARRAADAVARRGPPLRSGTAGACAHRGRPRARQRGRAGRRGPC